MTARQRASNKKFSAQSFEFDIKICDLPRRAKLCVGIFEQRGSGVGRGSGGNKQQIKANEMAADINNSGQQQHPLYWVNCNIFDYRARLRWRNTFHMWNYSSADGCAPTHFCLSPLRQNFSNQNPREKVDLVLSFDHYAASESGGGLTIEFPPSGQHQPTAEDDDQCLKSYLSGGRNSAGTISKLFAQVSALI